jgi:type IV pilus assembly protein PilA
MITVALVGILAAVALPAYNDYHAKAKVSERLAAASPCRAAVTEGYQTDDACPGANNWGCESAVQTSNYVGSVSTSPDGAITITASSAGVLPPALQGTAFVLTPTDASGNALTFAPRATIGGFTCQASTMPAKYLPGSCRG